MTSPKTFEAFNVASPFLGTSLRGVFLYGLTLIFLGLGPSLDKSDSHKILKKDFF